VVESWEPGHVQNQDHRHLRRAADASAMEPLLVQRKKDSRLGSRDGLRMKHGDTPQGDGIWCQGTACQLPQPNAADAPAAPAYVASRPDIDHTGPSPCCEPGVPPGAEHAHKRVGKKDGGALSVARGKVGERQHRAGVRSWREEEGRELLRVAAVASSLGISIPPPAGLLLRCTE
jgi:hypothetical protein